MIYVINQDGKSRIVADGGEKITARIDFAMQMQPKLRPIQVGLLSPFDRDHVISVSPDMRVVLHFGIGGNSQLLSLSDPQVRNYLQGQQTLWLV